MHGLGLTTVNLSTDFEVFNLTHYKHMKGDTNMDKKLSYSRGTARHAILVNSCDVSRVVGRDKNVKFGRQVDRSKC